MQNYRTSNFNKRVQLYAALAYTRQIKQGEEVEKLQKVYVISLCKYPIFDHKDYASWHINTNQSSKSVTDTGCNDISFCFLELSKFKKKLEKNNTLNELEQWTLFFKDCVTLNENENKSRLTPHIQKALKTLNSTNYSVKEIENYAKSVKNSDNITFILSQKNLKKNLLTKNY